MFEPRPAPAGYRPAATAAEAAALTIAARRSLLDAMVRAGAPERSIAACRANLANAERALRDATRSR